MQIIFDSTRRVNPVSRVQGFGRGLVRYTPYQTIKHTANDEAEYVRELAEERESARREFEQVMEERAMQAAWDDVMAGGVVYC